MVHLPFTKAMDKKKICAEYEYGKIHGKYISYEESRSNILEYILQFNRGKIVKSWKFNFFCLLKMICSKCNKNFDLKEIGLSHEPCKGTNWKVYMQDYELINIEIY